MKRFLLLVLESELKLAGRSEEPTGVVALKGNEYEEMTLGRKGFLGFYDWLREPSGALVGIRLSIDTSSKALIEMLPSRSYITRNSPEVFSVMFRTADQIDEEASMDQDFGHTRAFKGPGRTIVLTIDAEGLEPDEFEALSND